MAMREMWKKIVFSPQIRCCLMEGREGFQRMNLHSGGITKQGGLIATENTGGDLNNLKQVMVSDLGKTKEEEEEEEEQPKLVFKIDRGRAYRSLLDSYERRLWKERGEEWRRSYVDIRSCSFWLKSIHEVFKEEKLQLHEEDNGDGRLLLSMKILGPDGMCSTKKSGSLRGGIIQFTTASPATGLLCNTNKLSVDRGPFELPTQSVNGLVCVVINEAFLIYNAVTGDMSDWTEMPTKKRRRVTSIALGYNPETDEYKVVCISNTFKEQAGVIDVLTVGERRWRRVGTRYHHYAIVNDPFYVNGVIHWPYRSKDSGKVISILTFDVVSGVVSEIQIPPDSVSPGFRLLEVDGRVAVFQRISNCEASLWVIRAHKDDSLAWFEEKIAMPYAWTVDPELSIEALAGTNLILVKQERQNRIFCYNRKTKKCRKFLTSPHGGPYDWERIIQV